MTTFGRVLVPPPPPPPPPLLVPLVVNDHVGDAATIARFAGVAKVRDTIFQKYAVPLDSAVDAVQE